jgi:hypothetical protein
MENSQDKNKQEPQAQTPSLFSLGIPSSLGLSNNPLSYLCSHESKLPQDEQTKNNIFMQKRNRMDSDKMDITSEQEIKSGEGGETGNDLNMKSPLQKNKLYQLNQSNNHEQFVCKKMSMDIDDDVTNSNASNKKFMGCNCKNSGCLKRYCECFSRMKYCDANCQCKNCLNNIKNEKERNEAIRIYLIKSPVSFKKINMDLNNVTCNCKKSNCLKNYCECFQFGLKCTYSCGCVDCKNRNLFEKKLFFVENNCEPKKETNQNNNINSFEKQKNNINNQNNNIINLQEDEGNINNVNNNNKININNNNLEKKENIKKNINPQFIVNKNTNNIITNISPTKMKNRTRFLSFDDDMSQISQWNNLNLKKIEIANNKLIIDNYNVNQPDDIGYSYQAFQPINFTNNFYNNNTNNNLNNNNNNNVIVTRKNSAFSAIIK